MDFTAEFNRNLDPYVEEWKEFLRFQSISVDPKHNADCRACAEWLTAHLKKIGFNSQLLETSSKPAVFAERKGDPEKPSILLYGHYDVQPVDPLEEWNHPPFEPILKNGRIQARGASDDKGQLFYVLKALETLIADNAPMPTVKMILDGEEECGSKGLSHALNEWQEMLQADILMVADTGTVASRAPTIVMGLRGIAGLTAVLSGPAHDLHSGTHGGIAPNPAAGIAALAATLHNSDGSVAVEGFYDSIESPSELERQLATIEPFDSTAYESRTGVPPCAGEKKFTPQERAGFRPTIEINGIHSGYGGVGGKTIIPATALLKLSARLVPGQDPDKCLSAIIAHLEKHTPEGLRLKIIEKESAGPGIRLNVQSPIAAKAKKILDEIMNMETVFLWEGASIPIVANLSEISGAEPLLVGFGHDEDKIHAPNESFSIEQFRHGYLYVASILGDSK